MYSFAPYLNVETATIYADMPRQFRGAGRALKRLMKPALTSVAGLAAILTPAPLSKNDRYVPPQTDQVPKVPLPVAGLTERRLPTPSRNNVLNMTQAVQAKYIRDGIELRGMMGACRYGVGDCPPNIRAFTDMIDAVRALPTPMMKILAINGWVNTYLRFDNQEEVNAHTDVQHRTLAASLIARKGVCDEYAQLKLFALGEAGFKNDDVRWLKEAFYVNGKYTGNHAVVVARAEGQEWIMNLISTSLADGSTLSMDRARNAARNFSVVENSVAQINYRRSTFSAYAGLKAPVLVPISSFNSVTRAVYEGYVSMNLASMPLTDQIKTGTAVRVALKDLPAGQNPVLDRVTDIILASLRASYVVEAPKPPDPQSSPAPQRQVTAAASQPKTEPLRL